MAKKHGLSGQPRDSSGLTRIEIAGFKSIRQKQAVEVRPLTILAGQNSSGKSSLMQPLLLMKQTLECAHDPGALLLAGPNVRFSSADQLLFHAPGYSSTAIEVGLQTANNKSTKFTFSRGTNRRLELESVIEQIDDEVTTLRPEMTVEDFLRQPGVPVELRSLIQSVAGSVNLQPAVTRNRFFLQIGIGSASDAAFLFGSGGDVERVLRHFIHIPGLRGNPERTYPVTAIAQDFPGAFSSYVASIVASWEKMRDSRLAQLGHDLRHLGLTWKVTASEVDDTQVELKVGRLPQAIRGGAHDLVSIADVGFGLSQTLPVVVALLVAKPNQVVYVEQPEIHLHPRAQVALAQLLANAAERGVRIVAETHSSLVLLGVQTLVANGELDPRIVSLNWFQRNVEGATEIRSAELDESGAFGDWPEDFDQVTLETQSKYLDAAEARRGRHSA